MYGIYANMWGIWMVNVTIYGIHGSYGIWWLLKVTILVTILTTIWYIMWLKIFFFSTQAVRCAEQSYRPARTIRIRGARCSGWWRRKMLILLGGNEKPRGNHEETDGFVFSANVFRQMQKLDWSLRENLHRKPWFWPWNMDKKWGFPRFL